MSRAPNLVGKVFGKLTVTAQLESTEKQLSRWLCKCECGTDHVVLGYCLTRTSNPTRSCGCASAERAKKGLRTTHGMSKTSTYLAWNNMWRRCSDPSNIAYETYAERRPPDEWKDFAVFLKDMGEKPKGKFSIERVDNDKPYGPDNCVWASPYEQNLNKCNTLFVEHNGEKIALKRLTDRLGLKYQAVHSRLQRGWSIEDAVTKPLRVTK